jgi:radical SAM superfamily enzyme YgiQ (UPF0313 family)
MKLLLVDNLILPEEGSLALLDVHPHLGLLALAAAAEGGGHGVSIYDPKRLIRSGELTYDATLYERVATELLAQRPDAIGFTTLGCSFLFAINVAALLKQREPELPILLGGPHATMLHRQILERFPQFDIVARHECDEIFPEMLEHLDRRCFERIPGMSWRVSGSLRFTEGKPKVEDLDSLAIASYDHYPVAELGLSLLRIEAGRGCPFHCTFCSTAGFFQRSFRLKSAERLVRELDLLHVRYGISDFKLDHDMFTVNRRKIVEFCEAVAGRGYRWRASARVDCVDEELLETMAASGCAGLYFGIESGSARIQEVCQKRLDLDLVLPILSVAERLGIETTASFITGYPEENEQDQDETLDLLGCCVRPSCLTQLHILAPEPGTPMFDAHRHELAYDDYGGPYNAEFVGADDEALVREYPDIFQTYYHYPAAMPRFRYIFAVEAVALLRRLGPIVLKYILRAYGGSLANLVHDLRRFAAARTPDRLPDAELCEAYVSATFGPDHHVTSLVRYALQVNDGGSERLLPPAMRLPALDPEAPYCLAAGVRILPGMHDCALLLERIADDTESMLLDDAKALRRDVTYVLTPAASYRIDPGVKAVLEMFEQPRRCADVVQSIREATGVPTIDRRFFESLVDAGILAAQA